MYTLENDFLLLVKAGASIPPWDHDACSPLFQISPPPYFRKIFGLSGKVFTIWPFPKKFLDFHPEKFLMTFLFQISPLFSLFQYISPTCFAKIILLPPTFTNFPPCFRQIHLLFTYFTCIVFPPLLWPWCIYASPNARTGRPWLPGSQNVLHLGLKCSKSRRLGFMNSAFS